MIHCWRRRREAEGPFIRQVRSSLATRAVLIGWQSESPTGFDALRHLTTPPGLSANTRMTNGTDNE